MDKKIDELKKHFEALEKERQTLLEQRTELDKKISNIVLEQIRTEGGVKALVEMKKEQESVKEGD